MRGDGSQSKSKSKSFQCKLEDSPPADLSPQEDKHEDPWIQKDRLRGISGTTTTIDIPGTTTTTDISGTTTTIDICAVDEVPKGEWLLQSAKGRNRPVQQSGTVFVQPEPRPLTNDCLIQSLTDDTFTSVCIDSGAGESVCPIEAFPSYEKKKTYKTGTTYKAAGGQKLFNVGEVKPYFKSNGVAGCMAFQATTDVKKPLAAASRITEKTHHLRRRGAR